MGCAASATARAQVGPDDGATSEKEKEKAFSRAQASPTHVVENTQSQCTTPARLDLQDSAKLKEASPVKVEGGSIRASRAEVKPLPSAELTAVQEFDLETVHSIVERKRSSAPSQASKVVPDVDPEAPAGAIVSRSSIPLGDGGGGSAAARRRSQGRRGSPDGDSGTLPRNSSADGSPLTPKRTSADGGVGGWTTSSLAPASPPLLGGAISSQAGGSVHAGGSQNGNGLVIASSLSSPLGRGSTNGGAGLVAGILKSNSKEGGNRSVRAPGTRSIVFKDADMTKEFVAGNKDDEDLADEDCLSEDAPLGLPSTHSLGRTSIASSAAGGSLAAGLSAASSGALGVLGGADIGSSGNLLKGLRAGSILAPMRLESLTEGPHFPPDVLAGPSTSISARMGSQILLAKKGDPLLAPPLGVWWTHQPVAPHLGAAGCEPGGTLSLFLHAGHPPASAPSADTYTPVEEMEAGRSRAATQPGCQRGTPWPDLRPHHLAHLPAGPLAPGPAPPVGDLPPVSPPRVRPKLPPQAPLSRLSRRAAAYVAPPPHADDPLLMPTPAVHAITHPVQQLLAPNKLFRSADSQSSVAAAAVGLPPVKSTGHRSIGSRSIGVRSEVSFAVASRDIATPFMKGVRSGASVTLPTRGDSVASSMGAGADPGADGHGADASRRSRLSRLGETSEPGAADMPGSAGDKTSQSGHASKRPPKRGGREWDAKGARWRRASAFESSAHCAISLRFLRLLLTEHVVPLAAQLHKPLAQLTTAMVNEMVVKKLTQEDQCRLVDVPGLVPKEDVGEPDYFISHAWSNPFAHLVQCVCDHLSGALESTKVWIDIAAVNQHPTEQQQDDLANLRNAIYKSKATLMCLDVTGAPLKRVWCLYECDNTITIHGPDRLALLTPNFSVKDMASVFKSISVDNAGAYKQSDKDKILEDIIAHHGSTTAFDTKLKLLFLLEPLDTQTEMESLLEGTGGAQEYDFSALQLWLTSPRAPQVCVVSGPAGSGKSTISAALCWDEEARQRRHKAISHTRVQPSGSNTSTSSGGAAPVRSTPTRKPTRQMSGLGGNNNSPVVHAYHFCKYSDVRRQSPIRIVKTLAYQLAQRLPLLRSYYAGLDLAQVQQLHQASTAFRLLLLKPLTTLLPRDEQVVLLIDAMDEADSHSQLPLDNSVLQLMLHQLSCLPRNVRLITSTRSAPHLMGPLRRKFHGALELTPAMVRRRETTLAQLERRLTSRFGGEAAGAIMSCGGGENNLVYYSVVMLLDPPLERAAVPESLAGCYNAVFEAGWPRLTPPQRVEAVKALQVLMAAREPLQLSLLAGLGLEHVLALLPGWGTLLYEREYKVYTLHKSLYDWLSDPAAAGEFYADPRVGHATLGRYLFNAAHPLPAYGAKYLVTHLLAAGKLRELLDQAVSDMDHLEAVCRVGHVFRLHAELAAAEPKSGAVKDVVRWLGLNSHVLWAHPAAVVQLANEAPNTSAFMIALRRPRRSSTVAAELVAAATAGGAGAGGLAMASSSPPVTLLNKRRTWPAQLSILAQHHRAVNSVSFNPAGTLLASGSEDRSVRLWDPLTGEQKAVLFGHSGQVLGVAFSPNGALIASGSVDSTVRLWDASTGEAKGELVGHVDWVRDVAFAPAAGSPPGAPSAPGKLLASCGDDKTVKLWELSGPQPTLRATMAGHTDVVYSVSFSPDGALLASGSADQSIRLWDPATGRQAGRALVAHKFPVTTVAFSPDGKTLASGSHDKLILLWDMEACRESGVPAAELAGHTDKVLSVAFAPDSALLVSASADGSMRIWDVASRRVRGVLLGHASSVVAAAFAPGGQLIASAASDNTVRLWDPRVACESGSVEEASVSHMDSVTSVCFSPSGHTVASAGADWTVRLWDPSDGNHRVLLQGHTDVVRCVLFSPTGHLLASASSDWTVRLWDPVSKMETGVLAGHQDRVLTIAWSPNSRMLASACHSGTIIVWDAVTMDIRHTLKAHTAPVNSLAFAPNNKSLASGSSDKTVRVWQVQLGEQQVLIKGHAGGVNAVEYDSTGKLLASSSLEEKMVRVWDPLSGALLCIISNAALCSPGSFSMYSLERHAPCVRAISLKPRPGMGVGGSTGGGTAAAAGVAAAPTSNGAIAFGRSPSFTPQHVLQPSMTMRMERNSPNGLVLSPGGNSTEINYAFNVSSQSAPQLGGFPSNGGAVPGGGYRRSSGGGGTAAAGFNANASLRDSNGSPPVLQTAMSMRSNLSSMDEIPRLMELVSEADNPIVPIYTQFVSPRCVAMYGNKVVMSDGPHLYFFESNEGKIVGWKNRAQSAAV